MKTSEQGLTLIKQYEGISLKPYKDSAGLWTIGVGHLLTPSEAQKFAGGISQATCDALFRLDIYNAEKSVLSLTKVPLSQGQFDALVSFVFNLGKERYRASTLRARLNRYDYDGARGEFGRWVWCAGRKLAGLVRRRKAERDLFNTPRRTI